MRRLRFSAGRGIPTPPNAAYFTTVYNVRLNLSADVSCAETLGDSFGGNGGGIA